MNKKWKDDIIEIISYFFWSVSLWYLVHASESDPETLKLVGVAVNLSSAAAFYKGNIWDHLKEMIKCASIVWATELGSVVMWGISNETTKDTVAMTVAMTVIYSIIALIVVPMIKRFDGHWIVVFAYFLFIAIPPLLGAKSILALIVAAIIVVFIYINISKKEKREEQKKAELNKISCQKQEDKEKHIRELEEKATQYDELIIKYNKLKDIIEEGKKSRKKDRKMKRANRKKKR